MAIAWEKTSYPRTMFKRCMKDGVFRNDVGGECCLNWPRDESLDACTKEREHEDNIQTGAIERNGADALSTPAARACYFVQLLWLWLL